MDLLIVEDEAVLAKALVRGLTETGHACVWARDGRGGLDLAFTQKFDVVILDLLLPDIGGLEMLRTLRSAGVRTPVLVLTALGSVENRVTGLDAGADDYLIKPFAFPELTARLTALSRRATARPAMTLTAGPMRLDLTTRKVTRQEAEVDLSPTEFSVLELLMRHAGQVVTRKMLSQHLWDDDWDGVTNVIDVHINRLRSKIDRGFDDRLIHTVRGRGYVLRTS